MRLTGWQKIGILMSIMWALGAGIHTRNDIVESADTFAKSVYDTCKFKKEVEHDVDLSSCEKDKIGTTEMWMKDSGKNVAFAALVPIPFGWLAGFILLYLWRIQVAGFRAMVPWTMLSKPKKGFVIFCIASLGVGLLFVSLEAMNLYVDTQVPVALSPFVNVIKTGNDLVLVTGTWTRHGSTDGAAMADPLQTSRIECNRTTNSCTEARAIVGGNVLTTELVNYEVSSWTDASIILRNDAFCFEEVFTIDLNTEAVSGAGRRINSETAACKSPFGTETEWRYQMEKGFPIYWDLRMKARPIALRVLQALFGN